MNKEIKEILQTIELNAEISISEANKIKVISTDYFARYSAGRIKDRNEDTIQLVSTLKRLLCDLRAARTRTKNNRAETTAKA